MPPTPNREYHPLRRIARWLRLIRHRRGYGVHSPLAFQFITDVIYNTQPYYAYQTLSQPLKPSILHLDLYDPESGLTSKDLQLIFRLVNYQEPHTITLHTTSHTIHTYAAAARPSAHIHTTTTQQPPPQSDLAYYDTPPTQLTPSPMTIIRGIHRTPQAQQQWQHLCQQPNINLTFDIGRFGIILQRPKIHKQNYRVNYF